MLYYYAIIALHCIELCRVNVYLFLEFKPAQINTNRVRTNRHQNGPKLAPDVNIIQNPARTV